MTRRKYICFIITVRGAELNYKCQKLYKLDHALNEFESFKLTVRGAELKRAEYMEIRILFSILD